MVDSPYQLVQDFFHQQYDMVKSGFPVVSTFCLRMVSQIGTLPFVLLGFVTPVRETQLGPGGFLLGDGYLDPIVGVYTPNFKANKPYMDGMGSNDV